ncbi:hypothetical protein HF909_10675 [Ralstonia pseudosolanacearum]|uniref:Uncharacterized protein n=1 Tax=Ralstonia solanacearum TaxID=305 RepID=A0AA92K206_RALSL|nr:hypothetical protein [Ralstonia pseudosolanacearum]QOK96848.1 hypothetical protein HF909_10675 [Ralstonia pseudosolanacearum]
MEVLTNTEKARITLLQRIAAELANMAADTLEPCAGLPIDTDLREKLAADVYQALRSNMPTLANVRHALDAIPAAA